MAIEDSLDSLSVCFMNPALLPDWFWLPTAYAIKDQGLINYVIPPVPRGNDAVPINQAVDMVEEVMEPYDEQFIVSLSRGIELGVRYWQRMEQKQQLDRIIGWMVISSVGPRGYESRLTLPRDLKRHSDDFAEGIQITEEQMEIIDPHAADVTMLRDIPDPKLAAYVRQNLVRERPLTNAEVEMVPEYKPGSINLSWYIGRNDKVDNKDLSAAMAQGCFGVEPTYTDWGHIGPLSHTEEVSSAILQEIVHSYNLRSRCIEYEV